jgi:SAM-dependent methyltransferase
VNRLEFQRGWALGEVVNLGCGDDPAELGAAAVHVDIDRWNHPRFVQADICFLPFANDAFDTAILGDVLEHVVDPERAVREAARVAYRLVMTIPEERLLPSVGQHVELGIRMRADHYRKEHGALVEGMSDDAVIDFHKRTDPRYLAGVPERVVAHDGHINRFDDAWVERLIKAAGKRQSIYSKVPEPAGETWLITLWN